MQHIVIYRPHGKLNHETKYYGPTMLLQMISSARGQFTELEHEHPGCKYIQELVNPDDRT